MHDDLKRDVQRKEAEDDIAAPKEGVPESS
jgi:hypothetical protein